MSLFLCVYIYTQERNEHDNNGRRLWYVDEWKMVTRVEEALVQLVEMVDQMARFD